VRSRSRRSVTAARSCAQRASRSAGLPATVVTIPELSACTLMLLLENLKREKASGKGLLPLLPLLPLLLSGSDGFRACVQSIVWITEAPAGLQCAPCSSIRAALTIGSASRRTSQPRWSSSAARTSRLDGCARCCATGSPATASRASQRCVLSSALCARVLS
jgi:hypothetical protein